MPNSNTIEVHACDESVYLFTEVVECSVKSGVLSICRAINSDENGNYELKIIGQFNIDKIIGWHVVTDPIV